MSTQAILQPRHKRNGITSERNNPGVQFNDVQAPIPQFALAHEGLNLPECCSQLLLRQTSL